MKTGKRKGFTLLELLIAVGVLLAFLAGMAAVVRVAQNLLQEAKLGLYQKAVERSVLEVVSALEPDQMYSFAEITSLRVGDEEMMQGERNGQPVPLKAQVVLKGDKIRVEVTEQE